MGEYESELAALREKMKDSEFESAWQEGERLEMEDVITLAVRDASHR
jgi:hypothetical protein